MSLRIDDQNLADGTYQSEMIVNRINHHINHHFINHHYIIHHQSIIYILNFLNFLQGGITRLSVQ